MIAVAITIFGITFGSFVNALIWRIHEQTRTKGKKPTQDLSIVHGRSMCTHCKHTLAWRDLLPVLSWLELGGKCRYCSKPIGWQYPLVELATAAVFLLSYLQWPLPLEGLYWVALGLWLVALIGFMALLVYDLRWMLLPDRIVFPLQATAAFYAVILAIVERDPRVLLMAGLSVACSAGLFYVLHVVSDGKWIGGGDVKLGVVLGLFLGGPMEALGMLFVASLLGCIVGVPLLIGGKAKAQSKLPFGPFLIVATVVVYLFGADMIAWYERLILLS